MIGYGKLIKTDESERYVFMSRLAISRHAWMQGANDDYNVVSS